MRAGLVHEVGLVLAEFLVPAAAPRPELLLGHVGELVDVQEERHLAVAVPFVVLLDPVQVRLKNRKPLLVLFVVVHLVVVVLERLEPIRRRGDASARPARRFSGFAKQLLGSNGNKWNKRHDGNEQKMFRHDD